MENRFKGSLELDNGSELYKFQQAALQSGIAVSVMPKGNDKYHMELFTADIVDAEITDDTSNDNMMI